MPINCHDILVSSTMYVSRLLPTLVMVAVSQAASPESNPHSPLPVNGTGVQDTPVNLMGLILDRIVPFNKKRDPSQCYDSTFNK